MACFLGVGTINVLANILARPIRLLLRVHTARVPIHPYMPVSKLSKPYRRAGSAITRSESCLDLAATWYTRPGTRYASSTYFEVQQSVGISWGTKLTKNLTQCVFSYHQRKYVEPHTHQSDANTQNSTIYGILHICL